MSTPALRDFRPFLGYTPEDWPVAREFYGLVGFEETWAADNICEFDTGIGHRFLLAKHIGYDKRNAGMAQFWIESVDDWWDHLNGMHLPSRFDGVKVAEPTVTQWNWRMIYVWDPGGWLLHFGQPIA